MRIWKYQIKWSELTDLNETNYPVVVNALLPRIETLINSFGDEMAKANFELVVESLKEAKSFEEFTVAITDFASACDAYGVWILT